MFCATPNPPAVASETLPCALDTGHLQEASNLRSRLAEQEALQVQLGELVSQLNAGSSADDEFHGNPVQVTLREARLAREIAELRQQVACIEGRIDELRAALVSGTTSAESQAGHQAPLRGDIRRLQQLDSMALHLYEELRRRRSLGSAASATSS